MFESIAGYFPILYSICMIIFLYGPDDYRARQKIAELREKFIKEVDKDGTSAVSLDGAKATIQELSDAYRPAALFSKRRFVSLSGALANKHKEFVEELEDFLEKEKENENILVVYEPDFIEKKIAGKTLIMKPGADDKPAPLNKAEKKLYDRLLKSQFTQSFFPLSQLELQKTLAGMAKQAGASLSVPAANLLLRLVGSDLWPLSREIGKLAAFAQSKAGEGNEAIISEGDVRSMVSQSVTESIFALTDALGNKQTGAALKLLLEQLAGGAHPQYILTMMLWQFKTLASVRQGLDDGISPQALAKSLGLHPYVLEKSINQVRKFSLDSLKRALNKLIELDFKMKTGQGSLAELLPVTVASL